LEQLRRHIQAHTEIFRKPLIGFRALCQFNLTANGKIRALILRDFMNDGNIAALDQNVGYCRCQACPF